MLTLSASRASRRAIIASAACFGAGFPIGAGLLVALASSPSAARAALALPAVAAGLFLYMAVFEFAPPHAHGRKASLAQWLAFSSGVALAYATEALEHWAEAAAVGAAARCGSLSLGALLAPPPDVPIASPPPGAHSSLSLSRDCNLPRSLSLS